jgi:ABC-type lipoprotein release transport system permease subunit
MSTLSLALRNLLRNRRRSLTTLLAMGIGLVAILVFGGYKSNVIYGIETGVVQHSGHLQIQRMGLFLGRRRQPHFLWHCQLPALDGRHQKRPGARAHAGGGHPQFVAGRAGG